MSFGHKKTEHFLLDMKQTRKKMHEKHEADYHAKNQPSALSLPEAFGSRCNSPLLYVASLPLSFIKIAKLRKSYRIQLVLLKKLKNIR